MKEKAKWSTFYILDESGNFYLDVKDLQFWLRYNFDTEYKYKVELEQDMGNILLEEFNADGISLEEAKNKAREIIRNYLKESLELV